jgi:hypothetical protein
VAFRSFAGAPENYHRQTAVLLIPISAYPTGKKNCFLSHCTTYLSVLHVVVRRECAAFETFLPAQRRENRVATAWAICRMFEYLAFRWFWLRWAFEGFNNDGLHWLCQYVIRSTEAGVSWCPNGPVWPDWPPGTTSSSRAYNPILTSFSPSRLCTVDTVLHKCLCVYPGQTCSWPIYTATATTRMGFKSIYVITACLVPNYSFHVGEWELVCWS